jgi:magnesium-protoporphyrin O-methyltransferase
VCACQCRDYETLWDAEHAAKDLKRYRAKGPDKTTRLLVDALKGMGVGGASILDIGAGIGVVHHELLSAGARRATHIDATAPNVRAAEEETARRGHEGQVTFLQGDFVSLAGEIPAADVVTLDRVICCYPEMEALVSLSCAKARRLYGAVYPRERLLVKFVIAFGNFIRRLRGNAFRSYAHSIRAIDGTLEKGGLQQVWRSETFAWRVAVYSRVGDHAARG